MREYYINVEEHEKLKANNAFLLEEKTQAEEQYLKEKQIIISELTIHTCTVLDEWLCLLCRWRWNSQDWEGGAYNETEDSSRGAITEWETDHYWLVLSSLRIWGISYIN